MYYCDGHSESISRTLGKKWHKMNSPLVGMLADGETLFTEIILSKFSYIDELTVAESKEERSNLQRTRLYPHRNSSSQRTQVLDFLPLLGFGWDKIKMKIITMNVNLGITYEGIPLDKPLVPCVTVQDRFLFGSFKNEKIKRAYALIISFQ